MANLPLPSYYRLASTCSPLRAVKKLMGIIQYTLHYSSCEKTPLVKGKNMVFQIYVIGYGKVNQYLLILIKASKDSLLLFNFELLSLHKCLV